MTGNLMIESRILLLVCLSGIILGFFFFAGLWWTLQKALTSSRPELWFVASFVLRMAVTLLSFYCLSYGRWERLLACLLGFVIARLGVTWCLRPLASGKTRSTPEVVNAH
jgi:F1F0 ATPase subunit 2